jgi:integrase
MCPNAGNMGFLYALKVPFYILLCPLWRKQMSLQPNYATMSMQEAQELLMNIEKRELTQKYTIPKKPGKDGYYRVTISDPLTKSGRTTLCGKTPEELLEKLYLHEKHSPRSHTRKTFKDLCEMVICQKLVYAKGDKLISRQNTVDKNRSDYHRFFDGTSFEKKFIDMISKQDIEDICLYNLKRYDLNKKAFLSMRGLLRETFAYAYSESLINDNPFSRIIFDKKYDGLLKGTIAPTERVHTEEEIVQILAYLHELQKKEPANVRAYALELQILISCRRGEVAPLRRSDVFATCISISREQLTIKRKDGVPEHWKIVEHTKNGENRKFPIDNHVREYLTRLFAMLDKYYPRTEYLFPDKTTKNKVINNNVVYRLYRSICRKLGITLCRDVIKGPHSFRRNGITNIVNATGNVYLASQMYGNSPNVALSNYYTGIDTSAALEALNNRKLS